MERDKAILMAVADRLRGKGDDVRMIQEENLGFVARQEKMSPDLILSMGRCPETLRWLEEKGAWTINSPTSVARCSRGVLVRYMQETGVPVPPAIGDHGYWLKRGDSAQTKDDVVFVADVVELEEKKRQFRQRGITGYTVSAHVEGDVVKCYGVRETGFFRYFYPTDDGVTKFGDEQRNGPARHYAFNVLSMQQAMEKLAAAVGLYVYGGDCVVRSDGTFCIIDFNDWPSFSRCREEAADAIVSIVRKGEME